MSKDACYKNIMRLMEAFGLDRDTAYAMICLEATLYGLHTDDPKVVDMLMNDLTRSSTELTLDMGDMA